MGKKSLIAILIVYGMLVAISSGNVYAAEKYNFFCGSSASTSTTYAHAIAIAAAIMKEVPEVNIKVMETAGGLENTRLYARGENEITSSTSFEVRDLYNGKGKFEGKPMPTARLIFNEAPKAQQYFVTKASGVASLVELQGKPFGSGATGSTSEVHTKKIFEALGIQPKWFSSSWDHLTQAAADGRIVGFAKSGGGADAMIVQVAVSKPIKFLGMTKEQRDKITALGYLPISIKRGTYPGQDEEVQTVCYTMPWLIKKELPEQLVYRMLKAVNKHYTEMAKTDAMAQETIDMFGSVIDATVKVPTIPLHLGAYKYLRELGVQIPEVMVPPEAKKAK